MYQKNTAVADAAKLELCKIQNALKEDSETQTTIPGLSFSSGWKDIVFSVETNMERFIEASPKVFLKILRRLNDEVAEYRIFALHYNQLDKNILRFNPLTRKWFLRKRRKSLAQITAQIKALEGLERSPISQPGAHSAVLSYDTIKSIIGFDEKVDEVENVLLANNKHDFIAYGITGMSGTGKTALAWKLFNSPRICQEFPLRIWVCLTKLNEGDQSDEAKLVEIVRYMLEKLEYEVSEEPNIIQLITELSNRLSKQKYLIVLDNVGLKDSWYLDLQVVNRLSCGLPSGGAVLVTSRHEHLVKRMVGKHTRCITRLDHESVWLREICWKVFKDSLEKDETFRSHGIEKRLVGELQSSSAIAQQIFNSAKIREEFPTRIWVRLSDLDGEEEEEEELFYDMDLRKITLHLMRELKYNDTNNEVFLRGTDIDMIHFLTDDYEEYSSSDVGDVIEHIGAYEKLRGTFHGVDDDMVSRLSWLKRELSKHKYLIVFDGVWHENYKWYAYLRYAFPKGTGTNGGAVIVTRKCEDLVKRMVGREHSFSAFLDQEKCLEKIEDDIKYKIQGLPLAAQRLAQIIPNQLHQLANRRIQEGRVGVWPADWALKLT